MKIFRLGELFAGAGGLAWGAVHAECARGGKIIHAWANDCDPSTCATYIKNICPDAPDTVICCDVRNLNLDALGNIDALAFGFPCNDFSVVGKRRGLNGKYGLLYRHAVAALEKFQPDWFVAENVRGLLSANGGEAKSKILDGFRDAGYKIFPHLYKFEEYGIPQTRHRIIVVGIRNDIEKFFRPPSPAPYGGKNISSRHALENPPIPHDAANHERTKHSPDVVARLEYIKPGQNAFNADIPPEFQLHVKSATLSNIYRRLNPDKPSYTVTGSGGGGSHIYHYDELRALTNRERARLQTFPDDFIFEGAKESVRRQIGMAVPCAGAKIIFEAILKTFAGVEYVSVPCNISFDNAINLFAENFREDVR